MNDIKIAVRPECLNLPFVASSQLQSFIQRFLAHGSRCRRLAGEIRRAIFERNSRSAAGIRGHAIVRMDRVVAGDVRWGWWRTASLERRYRMSMSGKGGVHATFSRCCC
jgi:hypothetical protein